MKAYIMVDFEGIAGMIEWDDYATDTPAAVEKRGRMRRLLTAEVNSAIEGVIAAGVEDVLVWDSHGPSGNCNNIYIEDLHPEAWVIQGHKGLPEFYPLLDKSFDVGLYVGGHAMEGTPYAILPHTVTEMNGARYGEVGMFIAMCGWFGVPAVFVSGDKATIQEVQQLVPNIFHVITKEAFGPYSAKTRVPRKSRQLIRAETEKAVRNRAEIRPYKIQPPYRIVSEGEEFMGDNLRKVHHEYLKDWAKFGDQSAEPERERLAQKRKEWSKRASFLAYD